MCYFITVGIRADRVDLLHRFQASGFGLNRSGNLSLRQIFPESFKLFEVTKGCCSCSIYPAPQQIDMANVRERYRRKGWSESKIERAVASKEHASSTHLNSGDTAAFMNALTAIASECSPLYLFCHMYSGSVVDETIECEGTSALSISAILSSGGIFPADNLVSLSR